MPARRPRRASGLRAAAEGAAVALLGAALGSGLAVLGHRLLGEGPLVTPLFRTWRLGLEPPLSLDLGVLALTAGLTVEVGVLTVVGAGASLVAWARGRA